MNNALNKTFYNKKKYILNSTELDILYTTLLPRLVYTDDEFCGYSSSNCKLTINFALSLFLKFGLLDYVNQAFNHFFPNTLGSMQIEIIKFLVYKNILPPVYPDKFDEERLRYTFDMERLPDYLYIFCFYVKRFLCYIYTDQSFLKLSNNNKRILIDLILVNISDFVSSNTSRGFEKEPISFTRAGNYLNKKRGIIPLFLSTRNFTSSLLQSFYAIARKGVSSNLLEMGNCLFFSPIDQSTYLVDSIDVKYSFNDLSRFLVSSDTRLRSRQASEGQKIIVNGNKSYPERNIINSPILDNIKFILNKTTMAFFSRSNEYNEIVDMVFSGYTRSSMIKNDSYSLKRDPEINYKINTDDIQNLIKMVFITIQSIQIPISHRVDFEDIRMGTLPNFTSKKGGQDYLKFLFQDYKEMLSPAILEQNELIRNPKREPAPFLKRRLPPPPPKKRY